MTKENTNKKAVRSEKELKAMLITVGEKQKALVTFAPDTQYIDTHVSVADDYAMPKKAFTEVNEDGKSITVCRPLYYVCRLSVDFAQDVKNITTGDKDYRKAENAKIMENAVGFKAVCRDITEKAGKTDKGFFYASASMPCPTTVNVNGSIAGLWAFTSKQLRQDFLDMVQTGINNGKYHLKTAKTGKAKELKKVKDIALCMGITYDEALKIAQEKGIIKK